MIRLIGYHYNKFTARHSSKARLHRSIDGTLVGSCFFNITKVLP